MSLMHVPRQSHAPNVLQLDIVPKEDLPDEGPPETEEQPPEQQPLAAGSTQGVPLFPDAGALMANSLDAALMFQQAQQAAGLIGMTGQTWPAAAGMGGGLPLAGLEGQPPPAADASSEQ